MLLLDALVDVGKFSNKLKQLSEDSTLIEKMIEIQMAEIIKQKHPSDYENFMERNADKLEEIKKRLRDKYSSSIHENLLKIVE